MNEEELRKEINRLRNYWGNIVFVNKMDVPIDKDNEWIVKNFGLFCFQKGKLEERERILNYINKLLNECKRNNPLSDYWAGKEIGLEQLQKEIGEERKK